MAGRVYLVGAGPGDPRLITLRGAQCLGRADVVLYDSLASPRLLALAPAGAEKVLVGKRHGRVTVPQEDIERRLVEEARRGKIVVRLKGGDPFIFGRGGEEAEACTRAGVEFEVVPGVTSAIAAPAAAGIPLTHRERASVVTIVTGSPGEKAGYDPYDWHALARTGGTLVFVMAVLPLAEITQRLLAAGMSATIPAAAVQWGTTPRQKTVVANLGTLAEKLRVARMRPPAVIVIGEVAELARVLSWYERLPLFGKRVVVTRAADQAPQLADRLFELGADVVEFPVIEIADADAAGAARVFSQLDSFDWLLLTSVNGVERFFGLLTKQDRDVRELGRVRIATIGPATRAAVEARGIKVAVQPAEYRAEALLSSLGAVAGKKILLARAAEARDVLPRELRARGADVEILPLYETVLPSVRPGVDLLDGVDAITFTSASTVRNYVEIAGDVGRRALERAVVAAIGPVTADALRGIGIEARVVPSEYTIPGLVAALADFFARHPRVE